MKKIGILSLFACSILVAGCNNCDCNCVNENETLNNIVAYCIDHGGTHTLIENDIGPYGKCDFPNGVVCEDQLIGTDLCNIEENPEIIDDCVTVDGEDSCAVDIEEPIVEEPEPSLIDGYIPILALYSTRDLTTEERDRLPILIEKYYDNFSLDIIDGTRVCIIKIDREAFESKELKNNIIANIMGMHFEPITDVSVINNGNFEKHFDLYDNGAIKEQGVYINGVKRGLWTTYDEDGNIISSNEYIVG